MRDLPTQVPGSSPPPSPASGPPSGPPTNQPPPSPPTQIAGQGAPTPAYGGQPVQPGQGGQQPGGTWSPQPTPPSWSSAGPSSSASSGGGGKGVALIVGIVVLVIALGVGTFFVVKGISGGDDTADDDDPTTSQTDTTSDPQTDTTSDPQTDTTSDPSGDPIVADPESPACIGGTPDQGGNKLVDGRLTGGGLTAEVAPRYYRRFKIDGTVYSQDGALKFADDTTGLSKLLDSSYVSGYILGSLAKSRGYTDVQQAAETALSCMEQSSNYSALTGREDISSEPIEVDGAEAWQITTELKVDPSSNPSGIDGDQLVLIVVDTGAANEFGLYVNYVPLGYPDYVDDQETVTDSLQLGG